MSEFKFACPVCGQHITADFKAAGSKLDCPTCFRKIVVPQAPGSTESKFILSAAEANKPRPPKTETALPAGAAPVSRGAMPVWIPLAAVAAACVAGGAWFVFHDKDSKSASPNAPGVKTSVQDTVAAGNEFPPSTNQLVWALDLSEKAYPTDVVSGRIHGRDFACERATLQGGTLTLRHGRSGTPDLGMSIYFFADGPEDLGGKTLSVTTNNVRSPRVMLRWKDAGQAVTEPFKSGYALKLEFGDVNAGRLPGKIYMCLPDEMQSCVAGTFNAEIRKPSPPKAH
jgi:hypothetical protein